MVEPFLKEKSKRFLGEFEEIMEKVGLPAAAGRVFAWLLICDPPCQTIDEIGLALDMDREIASQMGNMLTQFGVSEKVSLPDKECLVMRPIDELLQQRLGIIQEFRNTLDHALGLLKEQPERQYRLQGMRNFYALMEEELPKILVRWEAGEKLDKEATMGEGA